VTTKTDDKAIATAAKTGEKLQPNRGYKTPAATGIMTML
jgi:hypothetical protein